MNISLRFFRFSKTAPTAGFLIGVCLFLLSDLRELEACGPVRKSFAAQESKLEGGNRKAQVEQAVQLYQEALEMSDDVARQARFQKAKLAFEKLVDRSRHTPTSLLIGWGNAALQSNDRGTAVLAYRWAIEQDPFDQQALNNLNFVREQLPDWTQFESESGSTTGMLFFWRFLFTPSQLNWLMGLAFLAGCLLVASSVWWGLPMLRLLSLAPFLLWVILFSSEWLAGTDKDVNWAVFGAEETTVRVADSDISEPVFSAPVPAGAEAIVLEKREGWVQVEIGKGQTGWVRESSLLGIDD